MTEMAVQRSNAAGEGCRNNIENLAAWTLIDHSRRLNRIFAKSLIVNSLL